MLNISKLTALLVLSYLISFLIVNVLTWGEFTVIDFKLTTSLIFSPQITLLITAIVLWGNSFATNTKKHNKGGETNE